MKLFRESLWQSVAMYQSEFEATLTESLGQVARAPSRRTVLKFLGMLFAARLAPQWLRPPATQAAPLKGYSEHYLDWFEHPHDAPLNLLFSEYIGENTISFIFYNLSRHQLIAAHHPETPLPIASTFKAAVAMYFVHRIPSQVWQGVPVEYWGSTRPDQVPEVYHEAWQEHQNVLRDLYRMITISDNNAVGRVLCYVADIYGSIYPLYMFNDWSHSEVGLSQLSGMSDWPFGMYRHMDGNDLRYGGREANIDHRNVAYSNLFTARDMGLYYTWFLDGLAAEQQVVCGTLLNQIYAERRSNIERLALANSGMAFSKNGSLGRNESIAGIIITDAGIVQHGDGSMYLLSLLSANAESRIQGLFDLTDQALKGYYDIYIDTPSNLGTSSPDASTRYEAYLRQAYPPTTDLHPQAYNYAFVCKAGMSIYSWPDEANEIRNPVISSSRFGVNLLMQGALLRFVPLNEDWAELIPDDVADNIQTRLAERIFVKFADLLPISAEYVQAIPYFIDPSTSPDQKFVVVDIGQRTLSVIERSLVVFKTPIALSNIATPRGSYPVTSKWFCRSMQAWAPGVPFTAFFHEDGYAIHGSPWQRWAESVTQQNIGNRISAGCINVPNWVIDLGFYKRPVDELIFRWIGGLDTPRTAIYEHPSGLYQRARVFVVDHLSDLHRYQVPRAVAQSGVNWEHLISHIEYVPLLAPPTFFA